MVHHTQGLGASHMLQYPPRVDRFGLGGSTIYLGLCFMLSGGPTSWQSRKQPIVALSSTVLEYIAVVAATKESQWLWHLLQEICYSQHGPTRLYCDNQSCIQLNENPLFHDRSKHIELRYHFLREKVESNELELVFTTPKICGWICLQLWPR